MNQISYEKCLKAKKSYSAGRKYILTMIIFTIISMFIIPAFRSHCLFGISMSAYLIYSDTVNSYVTSTLPAIIASFFIVIPYLVHYILSKKHYWSMIVLLAICSIDCLFTIVVAVKTAQINDFFPLPDIIFHILCVLALVKSVVGGKILRTSFTAGVTVTDKEIYNFYRQEKLKAVKIAQNAASAPKKDIFGYDVHMTNDSAIELRCRCCGAPRNDTSSGFCEYCGAPFSGTSNDKNDKQF